MIADVSGHGTPAAVMMAITHSIAHTYPGAPDPPGEDARHVNQHLATRYTAGRRGVRHGLLRHLRSRRRKLTYASAGHNPPR